MKMKSTYKAEVQNLALETVWSLWSEAGVSGWARHHSETAIDLEPLLIATAWLGQFDARLLEEAFDWCVLNSRFASAVRLRNLLPTMHDPVRVAFGAFATTVRSRRKVSWPGAGTPLKISVTNRSTIPDLRRPALLQLRLRALFGVAARAEILRRMLPEPGRFFGIAELALHSAYGKDNVADALDLLTLAAITTETTMTSAGNAKLFRLESAAELVALVGPLPANQPDWSARFRILLRLVDFALGAPEDPTARAAAIFRLLELLQSDLRWIGTFPRLPLGVEAVNHDFNEWSVKALEAWASDHGNVPSSAVSHA
jgi:hypothetical protein